MGWLAALTALPLALGAQPQRTVLTELEPLCVRQGWGQLQKDRSVASQPMRIGERAFTTGLGTHAPSEIVYDLEGAYERFEAWVGVDAAMLSEDKASIVFKVLVDGRELFDSGLMRAATPARRVSVPVAGVRELTLIVGDGGDGRNSDHANWAEAVLLGSNPAAPAKLTPARSAKFSVHAAGLSLQLSQEGTIVGATLAGQRRAVRGETGLVGCTNVGPVVSRKLDGGGLEFTRRLAHAQTGQSATLLERFVPTRDSVRWELEIRGQGDPWSTGIETRWQWPESPDAKFWTTWDDPETEPGPWRSPLEMRPFTDRRFWYGAAHWSERDPDVSYVAWRGHRFVMPLAMVAEGRKDLGFSVVLSPEDTLLEMSLTTRRHNAFVFSRNDNRLSAERPVRLAMDLVAHAADWRAALGWMARRYPEYFNPPNPHAFEFAGLAAYSDWEGELDAAKLKRMGFRVNWKASYDFPYMGMFLPPIPDNEPYPRLVKGNTTSIAQLRDYSSRMRQSGFHVLNYFNVTEFGGNTGTAQDMDPKLAPADQWKNVNNFLYGQIADGILHDLQGRVFASWKGCIVMDAGAPKYRAFVLDQARRHVEKLPASSGICIDRMDWLRCYNFEADDGVTWRGGRPCRALATSWRSLLAEMGPIFHQADKAIFGNASACRLDLMRDMDGIYHEFGHNPGDFNCAALQCVLKPCMVWTPSEKTLQPDPDAYFQQHLQMGAFPTAPLPENDHTITPSAWADRQYLDYGPMFNALAGRKWVLQPHVIESDGALANLFEVPGGYVIPVTFGAARTSVGVRVLGSALAGKKRPVAEVLHPGTDKWVPVSVEKRRNHWALEVPLQRGCALVRLVGQ